MDSSGNLDRDNLRVFLLMRHSCAGGMPVGCLITTNESEATINNALKLYLTLIPGDAIGGRGEVGPSVIMTDDCEAERSALQTVFPSTTGCMAMVVG